MRTGKAALLLRAQRNPLVAELPAGPSDLQLAMSRAAAMQDLVGVSADRGDTSQTLVAGVDVRTQRWATALTANRTVTLSTTGAGNGARFRVVRTGLGAFTLDVGPGLKTIPAGTAGFVDAEYDGAAWRLAAWAP